MNERKIPENKVLFLTYENSIDENLFLKTINKTPGIVADTVFKFHCKPLRALRKLMINHKIPSLSMWFGEWYNHLASFRLCIVVGSSYTPNILEYLKYHFPDVRFIEYLWDKEFFSHYPIIPSKSYENWTFNKADADEYNISYNPQFYTKNLIFDKCKKKYDVSFVGGDRNGVFYNRAKMVSNAYGIFKKLGLKTFFWMVTNSADADPEIIGERLIDERNYYEIMANSKAVLEIVEPGKEWLTLRPMVALSNRIKVITNNVEMKYEKFYTPDDVFILGSRNTEELPEWLEQPFMDIEKDKLEWYDVENWIRRFG